MKKLALLFLIVALPFIIACGGGSGGSDAALNPFGFVVASFDTTSAATLGTNDVRSVIRPLSAGLMYAGTVAGVSSFDPNLASPVFSPLAGAPANVNRIVTDGTTGNFYVCSDTGLYLYDATAKTFTLDAAIGAKKVLTFTRQSTTVYWVGLEDVTVTTNSIAKVDTGVATFFGTAQGVTASAVADIHVDADMVMACGTGNVGKGGLFRYDPSGAQFVKQVVTVGLEKGASLFFRLGTNWYAGGPDSGLIVSANNGTSWTKTGLTTSSPVDFSLEYYALGSSQRYWISTDKAIYLTYDMVNFEPFASVKGLAGDSAAQAYTGTETVVWVANNGVSGGLSRLAFSGN